jgi:hypothetical protein
MNEFVQIAVIACSVALFALGGTGFKWMRRYVLPVCLGLVGAFLSSWWQGLGYALTLCAFLCMGYGERASWWYRLAIFTGYGAVSLWFGFSYWLIVTPCACMGLFWVSNWKPTANSFTWKTCEAAFGFLIAASFIAAIIS